jgi:hypothetical protein
VRFGFASAVALAVLVLLPLGAVWLAGRWRDPPRDRWALKPRKPPGEDLEFAEYRLRREYGLRDEGRWTAVRRAVDRGEAAPPDLRPAVAAWAGVVLARRPSRLRFSVRAWVGSVVLMAGYLTVVGLLLGAGRTVVFAIYAVVVVAIHNPWTARRRRTNAETALRVNS